MFIFGGFDSVSAEYYPYTVKVSLERLKEDRLTYQIIKGGPPPRASSSYCLLGSKIYTFGGGKVDEVFDDFWVFDVVKG